MKFNVLAEVEAYELFRNENVNWKFCMKHAIFSHKYSCEFILHIGTNDYSERLLKKMEEYGCTKEFIDAYKAAVDADAMRVLFYA